MANLSLPVDGTVPIEAVSVFGEFKIHMRFMTASERRSLRKGVRENEVKEVRIKALARAVELAEDVQTVFAHQAEHEALVEEYQQFQEGFYADRDARITGFSNLELEGVEVKLGDENHKKLIELSPDYHLAVIQVFDDMLNERAASKNSPPRPAHGRKAKVRHK